MLVVAASPNSALEAFSEEQVERLGVTLEVNVAISISRDIDRWAKGVDASTEEMWRPQNPAGLTIAPFLYHSLFVFGTDIADTMGAGHTDKNVVTRNVSAPFK